LGDGEIRLRYAGLIIFLSRIFSIVTGLVFVVLVTRRLSPTDFGLWQTISDYLVFFVFPSQVISPWVTRYVARGFNVSKTGILVNAGLSLIFFFSGSFLAPYAAASSQTSVFYYFLGCFSIPLEYAISSLEATASATKPEVQSYGFVAFELSKVGIGALAVAFLRLELFGVMMTMLFARLLQVIFLLFLLRRKIGGGFNRSMARKWFSLAWITIYGSTPSLLYSLNTFIWLILTGSTLPKAYMQAPMTIYTIISYSFLLSSALYPKILRGGGGRDVESALKLVLLFAVPLAVGAFVLANPLLRILREEYSVTENILRVLAVGGIFASVSGVFSTIISGTERVELKEDATFKDYVKSRIFLLPTLDNVALSIYVSSVFLLTYYSVLNRISYVTLIFYCALSSFIIGTPFVLYRWSIARKVMKFDFPWANLARYFIAAGVMTIFLLLFYPYGAYSEKIWYVLSNLLPVIGAGALIYFSIAYIIDRDARALINSTFAYLGQILWGRVKAT